MLAETTNRLCQLLAKNKVVILDGAMGTELERRGHDIRHPLWSGKILRDNPDEIKKVHQAYLSAGADIILTASYQIGNDPHLLERSVLVAQAACKPFSRIIAIGGSLGPYGACLADGSEYTGAYDVPFTKLVGFYMQRIVPLIAARVDFVAFETIPSLFETQAIKAAIKQVEWGSTRAWVSFTCKDEKNVVSGDALSVCVDAIQAENKIVAIGINCSAPNDTLALLAHLRHHTDKPCVVYPNKGSSWCTDSGWSVPSPEMDLSNWIDKYLSTGAQIIGGCCQTSPEDIERIHAKRLLVTKVRL